MEGQSWGARHPETGVSLLYRVGNFIQDKSSNAAFCDKMPQAAITTLARDISIKKCFGTGKLNGKDKANGKQSGGQPFYLSVQCHKLRIV